MQAQPTTLRPAGMSIDPDRAKKIAILYAIYLLIPWPWDWAPVIGDVCDALSVLVFYSAIKISKRTDGECDQ